MTALARIQRKRITGWRMPANTVYVGRGTLWGNPYRVDRFRDGLHYEAFKVYEPEIDRLHTFYYDDVSELSLHRKQAAKKAVDLYQEHWLPLADIAALKTALAGKNLACWCPTDQPCHADVLLELANQENPLPATPSPLQTKTVGVEQPVATEPVTLPDSGDSCTLTMELVDKEDNSVEKIEIQISGYSSSKAVVHALYNLGQEGYLANLYQALEGNGVEDDD